MPIHSYSHFTMNQKSFVIAALLAATALTVIATPLAYAQDTIDTITTITNQDVQQKNTGSGESKNVNEYQEQFRVTLRSAPVG